MNKFDLGAVSAYAMAKEKGYQGTEEEFAVLLANSGNNALAAAASAKEAAEAAAKAAQDAADGVKQAVAGDATKAEEAAALAQSVKDSIPQDYAAMSQDVAALTEEIDANAHCSTRMMIGGSMEEWSTEEYDVSAGHVYRIVIHPFAIRAWLTAGYAAYEVNGFRADGTSTCLSVCSVGNYAGNEEMVYLNNRSGEFTRVEVKLRPETDTNAFTSRIDITDYVDLEKISQYFMFDECVADFSSNAIDSTYQAVMLQIGHPVEVGETVNIKVDAPEADENSMYFNFYNGTERIHNLAIPAAVGSRVVTYTNKLVKSVTHIEAVLVKVIQQNLYTITVYNDKALAPRVDVLADQVSALANGAAQIPGYFKTHLNAAINRANANILNAGINGETFVFISDLHWESNAKNSPALIGAITAELPIENVIFGGDAINGGTYENSVANMNDIRKRFEGASKKFLSICGNHDCNALDGGTAFTNREFYTLLQKQSDYYANHADPSCYYYFYTDNPTTKTRMIFLDSGMQNPSYASDELSWLQQTVSNAPSGYNILVFVHVIFVPASGGTYNDPTTWEMTSFMIDVCEYLDGVTDKKVHAIFGGHSHYDYESKTAGGIPIVLIDCDARQTQMGSSQVLGTVNEQAFDIVTVNYATNTVHCTRVGRGSDRTIVK